MCRNRLTAAGLWLVCHLVQAQVLPIAETCTLPASVPYCSGICTVNGGKTFWVLNDNDSKSEIYEIDTSCSVMRTVKIASAGKKDWEDFTADDEGNLYIGDFGNNANNRKDLAIYRIPKSGMDGSDEVAAQKITYRYGQQTAFPPPAGEMNFDMEAMVWLNHRLHLFSKNRTSPFSGYTYHYQLPDQPGDYVIYPVDSFNTGPGPYLLFWVTGAALSKDRQRLVLLSHDKVWLFDPLDSLQFFNSPVKTLSLQHFSQKEGVSFAGHDDLYFADEINKTINNGGKLYHGKTVGTSGISDPPGPFRTSLIYAHELLQLDLSATDLLEIIDLQGRRITAFDPAVRSLQEMPSLVSGLYWVLLKSGRDIRRMLLFRD